MDRGIKTDVAIVYHDVGVQLSEDSLPLVVPPIESLDQPFHDFHVLLRHRPRSIPQVGMARQDWIGSYLSGQRRASSG
jgi:hypothetical protein